MVGPNNLGHVFATNSPNVSNPDLTEEMLNDLVLSTFFVFFATTRTGTQSLQPDANSPE